MSIASGELYPNGVDISPPSPDIQATVRPLGWLFQPSAGYPSVRVGAHAIDSADPQGNSIHFTPVKLAEDIRPSRSTASGVPAMVDVAKGGDTADLANLPGSEYLDGSGNMPSALAEANHGPYLADSSGASVSDGTPRYGGNVARNMGDRGADQVLTRAFYDRLLMNPNVVLREEWKASPVVTVVWAIAVIGAAGLVVGNIERAFRGSRGRGVAGTAAAAPAASAAAAAGTVTAVTKPVVQTAEESVKAAEDTVKAAEKAAADAAAAAAKAAT